MKIYISGASDDLIEVEGDIREEFCFIADGPYMGVLDIGGKLNVHAIYDGCWSFAPSMIDEDIPIPETWSVSFVKNDSRDYSTMLEVETDEPVRVLFQRSGS